MPSLEIKQTTFRFSGWCFTVNVSLPSRKEKKKKDKGSMELKNGVTFAQEQLAANLDPCSDGFGLECLGILLGLTVLPRLYCNSATP